MTDRRRSGPATLPRLLTVPQAAEGLSVCERTIWRWIEAGEIETYRLGRAVRIARPVPREAAEPLTIPDRPSQ
jgi:excisionase family DNA binding protein